MSASEWLRLGEIADRVSNLTQQSQAAAQAGDPEMAAYFFRLARQADQDRELIVQRLCGTITVDVAG
jgi:hypothetical protein